MKNFILSIILFVSVGFTQQAIKYIYLEHPTYDYLDYLINSDQWQPSFVFHQPYQLDSTLVFPNTVQGNYFSSYWDHYYKDGKLSLQFYASAEGKYDNEFKSRLAAMGGVHYVDKYITLANRTAVDQNYKYDAHFAGDLSESSSWIYGRVNDAYIQINYGAFGAFYGRLNRNLGPLVHKSLILSNNPYSYDHFLFDFTSKYFKLSVFMAQLENRDAFEYGVNDSIPTPVENARKYMTGHRLDIRILDNLQVAFTEIAIYGGENRQFEWAFLNPMNFYYAIQRNDQKQMNGVWTFDLFWKPWPKWTFYSQFLLDDIIVNNDPDVDDRSRYPDRLGLYFSARNADTFVEGLNTNISYTKIWNRTYQSFRTYENYHYREYGLGYPTASSEEFKLDLTYWGFFPFYLKNELTIGQYGNVEITDLFLGVKEDFPVEPVTDNLINSFTIDYFLSKKIQVSVRATYREKVDHYSNRYGERDNWVFSLKITALLTAGFGLD